MLEPQPINDDVFLEERKQTNIKTKKRTQIIYWNAPLTTQDKQGAKAF